MLAFPQVSRNHCRSRQIDWQIMETPVRPIALVTVAAITLMATVGTVRADSACGKNIAQTKADWQALQLEPASKPGAISKGIEGHEHVQAAVDSMRYHMAEAVSLCKEGKDHESLLHLNVVRAFLQLPEIQHPADHRYLFQGE
ncbi:MAG TPA: hypothetical protein VHO91_02900 [Rhodopila sp.]|nr:hypothetical protein [Rhodopila sp.]